MTFWEIIVELTSNASMHNVYTPKSKFWGWKCLKAITNGGFCHKLFLWQGGGHQIPSAPFCFQALLGKWIHSSTIVVDTCWNGVLVMAWVGKHISNHHCHFFLSFLSYTSTSQVVEVNLMVNGAHWWAIVNVIVICVQLEEITHTVQYILLTIWFIHNGEGAYYQIWCEGVGGSNPLPPP